MKTRNRKTHCNQSQHLYPEMQRLLLDVAPSGITFRGNGYSLPFHELQTGVDADQVQSFSQSKVLLTDLSLAYAPSFFPRHIAATSCWQNGHDQEFRLFFRQAMTHPTFPGTGNAPGRLRHFYCLQAFDPVGTGTTMDLQAGRGNEN